jgi:hypothetical protein
MKEGNYKQFEKNDKAGEKIIKHVLFKVRA